MIEKMCLKEKPAAVPKFSPVRGVEGTLVTDSDSSKIYFFLKEHPNEAFSSTEVARALSIKRPKNAIDFCRILAEKNYIFRLPFKIPTIGRYGGFLYAFSEKSLYQKLWMEVPEPIKKCLQVIETSDSIHCLQDLLDMSGATRNQAESWMRRIFHNKLNLIQRKSVEGIRTFYYNNNISEEKFQSLYSAYYKTEVLNQKKIGWLKGEEFEQFSTWVFVEYMKLKGMNVEISKFNREPIDYIGKVRIDISDLLGNNKHNDIVMTQFVISCKHYRLDRPLGSWYVLGLSGCLREGKTFRGDDIFSPRNSVGIIFCTTATSYAYDLCGLLGVRIFDLHKLFKMYQIVKQTTGQEHRLFENISARVSAYREKIKGDSNA